jgi:hypothetical protein
MHKRSIFLSVKDTLYPKKLALTSPTSGGLSVGVFRSRTQATELVSNIFLSLYIG